MEGLPLPVDKQVGVAVWGLALQPQPDQPLLAMQLDHVHQVWGQWVRDGPATPLADILVVPELHVHATIRPQVDLVALALQGPPAVRVHAGEYGESKVLTQLGL